MIEHLFILKKFDIGKIFSFIFLILLYTLFISISLISLNIFLFNIVSLIMLLDFSLENKFEFLNFVFFLVIPSLKYRFKPLELLEK